MFNFKSSTTKDKAWRRAGESPVLSNSVCWFAAPSGPLLKTKKCEPVNRNQSGARKCAA
jgi:hypothetical protein